MSATAATVLTIGGILAQGFAARQQGRANQQIANANAIALNNEAQLVKQKGIEEENIKREQTAQLKSKQRAGFAASGVDVNSGSALDVQEDTDFIGEIEALRIKNNFKRQAVTLQEQAGITRFGGEAKKRAGDSAFIGSVLSSGGAVLSSKWFNSDSKAKVIGN